MENDKQVLLLMNDYGNPLLPPFLIPKTKNLDSRKTNIDQLSAKTKE